MNLAKAIEIKLQWRKDNYPPALPDEMNADMLSIKALERCKYIAEHTDRWSGVLLPGETKD